MSNEKNNEDLEILESILNKDKQDFINKLIDIKKEIKRFEAIKNSISDDTEIHREYFEKLKIDNKCFPKVSNLHEKIIELYIHELIIKFYTFFEELLKYFFYKMLFGEKCNLFLKNYLFKGNLNPDRYCPNIEFNKINELFRKIFCEKSIILLLALSNDIKHIKNVYGNLIKARNKYAHVGGYEISFDLNEFNKLFYIAEYFIDEYFIIIENHEERLELQKKLDNLFDLLDNKLIKNIECKLNFKRKDHLKKIKMELEQSIVIFEKLNYEFSFYKNLYAELGKKLKCIALFENSSKDINYEDLKLLID